MHIAIAGNIGSGKTTLTKMLSSRFGWTPTLNLSTITRILKIIIRI